MTTAKQTMHCLPTIERYVREWLGVPLARLAGKPSRLSDAEIQKLRGLLERVIKHEPEAMSYLRAIAPLYALSDEENDSPAADALRDACDGPWRAVRQVGREEACEAIACLLAALGDGHAGRSNNPVE